MSARWFGETLFPDFRQEFPISRILYEGRSSFQRVLVFETPRFGRVLALDDVVQTTEADEFCYHEMLAHVPILAHGDAKRVAIIGGGDGGALEEVLKHPVSRVVMVEIDQTVVDVCREYLPSICGTAFEDARTELKIADGVRFMRETDESFDVIIVDSTDPMGPSMPLFDTAFYTDCRERLGDSGILIVQSGVAFMQPDEVRATAARLKPLFADTAAYVTQVPSYAAGFMTLGWGCRSAAARGVGIDELRRRHAAAKIQTRYYTPEVHQAAFALPGYIGLLQ